MILRRLADAITEQNWFTVVLEVLIVVVGIFTGLQVDDWNEVRKDRAEAQVYLGHLHEDVETDIASYILRAEDVRGKSEALHALLALIEAGDAPEMDPAAFFQLVHRSTDYGWAVPVVRSVTYRDMENNGKLVLIEDATLRFSLSDYYELSAQRTRRISGRFTGYAPAVYEVADPGAGIAVYDNDIETQSLKDNRAPVLALKDGEAAIQRFLTVAREEAFRKLLNAERNYSAFLISMLEAQVVDSETLLEEITQVIEEPR